MQIRSFRVPLALASIALIAAVAVHGRAATAQAAATPVTTQTPIAPPSNPDLGRALFIAHNCYGCHGGLAGGGMGPNLREAAEEHDAAKLHDVVLHGKSHMGMPDWEKKGMSSDEAWYIVSYLQTLGKPGEPTYFLGWRAHIPDSVTVHVLQPPAAQHLPPTG